MSILQEYETIKKEIGYRKFNMIEDYINEVCPQEKMKEYEEELTKIHKLNFYNWLDYKKKLEKKYGVIFLNDVLYKKQEWEKFEKWYQEKEKDKEIEILNFWLSDYDDMRCNATIKIDGKEVGNIIACYDETDLRYTFGDSDTEMNAIFIKDAFKELILCDLNDYLKLPKISECSKLLQSIYDDVCTSDSSMCHITEEDWQEFYEEEYTDKDIEILKEEVKKYNIEDVITFDDCEYKIIGWSDLETKFIDDRNLNLEKDMEKTI